MCKLHLKDILSSGFNSKKNIITNSLPIAIGKDYMEKLDIQDGFSLMKTKYTFFQPTQIEAKQNEKMLIIAISLKGNSKYTSLDKKKSISFKEGYTTISLSDHSEGIREFEDDENNQIRILLNESFLRKKLKDSIIEKYFENGKKDLNLMSFSPTTVQAKFILNDIINCKLIGDLKKLYLEYKALELLHLELTKLNFENKEIILDDYDIDAIHKAKEILLNNLQNPPSIINLAKQVHLNETKLKKGFKQLFNTSPYKLLNEYKMNMAKKLLEEGIYNINEVAQMVGYNFTSSFTHAFIKEFGIRPKDIIKTKKYFY